jgi:thiol-disulfide isomerase/thioredoxin
MPFWARSFAGVAALSLALPLSAAALTEIAKPDRIAASFASDASLRVVNLWATWCAPCVAEMDDLRAVEGEFRGRGVQFVGISLDDAIPGDRAETKAKVARFLEGKKIAYLNLYYTGRVPDIQDHYGFEGEIPITLIFDAKGKEVFRHQGRIDRPTLAAAITKHLGKRGRSR